MATDVSMKVPPHDSDAERAVLGSMLQTQDAITEATAVLTEQDFYEPKNQIIFSIIIRLFSAGEPADVITVANQLEKEDKLTQAGGSIYIADLVPSSPQAASVNSYASIVRDKALLRRVIESGRAIIEMGEKAGGAPAEQVVNMAQQKAMSLSDNRLRTDYVDIYNTAYETLSNISAIQSGQVKQGVDTGFVALDGLMHGLQPGQLVIVAGRPAMGKSTFAMDIARYAAFRQNITTIVFSLEMSRDEIAQRIISAETSIPLETLRAAQLDDRQWDRLNKEMGEMQNVPLLLDDSPNMSLMEIRSKCRTLKQGQASMKPLGLVVIDYLQLMSSTGAVESRQQEVSEFSRSLKLLAKELNVPVIALSQLNRGPEMRQDKKPMLSDLRESGSIEQDADEVLLVHRPDFYNKEDRPGEADIIVAKNRNGQTGTVGLSFDGANSRFLNLSQDVEQGI